MPLFIPQNHKSLFRQLLAGMYDAVLITDPNGHVLQINARAVEFFKYEEEEVVDRPVAVFIPGITPELVQRIRKGLGDNRHVMIDAKCQRKDGTAFQAEVSISQIDLMDPGDLVFTIRNVERRARQIHIYKSKENAFNLSGSALFVCAPDGHFRQANRAFCEMFGLEDDEEARKHTFTDFFSDEPLPRMFEQAMNGETGDVRIKTESDDDSSSEVDISLEPDLHGKKIFGVVGSVTNV